MIDVHIEKLDTGKGRQFAAKCLGFLTAYDLVPETQSSPNVRPVWMALAGTEQSLRPFVANVRLGRVMRRSDEKDEPENRISFLRSARVQLEWQREEEGATATIFYPDLFRLDPGFVDPDRVAFVCLAPEDWAVDQFHAVWDRPDPSPVLHTQVVAAKRPPKSEAWPDWLDELWLVKAVPTAWLFLAMLDARTRCPMPNDPRFALQVLVAALDAGLASLPNAWSKHSSYSRGWGYSHNRFTRCGLHGIRHAVAFNATHEQVDEFMAKQVAIFLKETR